MDKTDKILSHTITENWTCYFCGTDEEVDLNQETDSPRCEAGWIERECPRGHVWYVCPDCQTTDGLFECCPMCMDQGQLLPRLAAKRADCHRTQPEILDRLFCRTDNIMAEVIKVFITLLIGTIFGYFWAYMALH